jgi:hypothetical protein
MPTCPEGGFQAERANVRSLTPESHEVDRAEWLIQQEYRRQSRENSTEKGGLGEA